MTRLLDLREAYRRVNKPVVWRSLEKYGMDEKCLEGLNDLHEHTKFKVRGK